jgi:hypothetical protein
MQKSLVKKLTFILTLFFSFQNMFHFPIPDLWISDLLTIGYEDIPVIDSNFEQFYPCLEGDALVGVYFQPSVSIAKDRSNILEVTIFAHFYIHVLTTAFES